jgi:chloride channel, nucleotide-sensitive, 1A
MFHFFSLMPIIISCKPFEFEVNERLIEDQVELIISPPLKDKQLGKGRLVISEQSLFWNNQDLYLSIDYPSIIIHAISKQNDVNSVYCQLSSSIVVDDCGIPIEGSEVNEDSEQACIELSLLPEDGTKVDQLYQIISECSQLHPDEQMDDDRGWITSENVDRFYPNANEVAALNHLDAVLVNENGKRLGQFEDAEE